MRCFPLTASLSLQEDYAKAEADASKGNVSGGWQGTGLCALPIQADQSSQGALQ